MSMRSKRLVKKNKVLRLLIEGIRPISEMQKRKIGGFEPLESRLLFSADPAPIVFSFDNSFEGFGTVAAANDGEVAIVSSDIMVSAPHSGARYLRLRLNNRTAGRDTIEQQMLRTFDTRPGDSFFGWGIFDNDVNSSTTPPMAERKVRGQMGLHSIDGLHKKSFWYQTEKFAWNTDAGESPDTVTWNGMSEVLLRIDETSPNLRDARFAIDDLTWQRPNNAVDDSYNVDAGKVGEPKNVIVNDWYARVGADTVVSIRSELLVGGVGEPTRGKYGSLVIQSDGTYQFFPDSLAHLAPWHPPLSDAFAPGVRDQISVGTVAEIQNGFFHEQDLIVWIHGVNDKPTDIKCEPSVLSILENAGENAFIGAFSTEDPDHDDLFTYSLDTESGANDNALFNFSGNILRANNSLDRETKSSYLISVRSTDRGGLFTVKPFTITVNNVNEAPTASAPASFTVTEDVASNLQFSGTPFGDVDSVSPWTVTLTIADGVIAGNPGTGITVGGTATARTFSGSLTDLNAYFTTAGKITYTTALNNTSARTLTTVISDSDSPSLSSNPPATSLINITPVNDTPTDISLSPSIIPENAAANSTVGNLQTTDPDIANRFTYTFVAGIGDNDNSHFRISGSTIRSISSLNYEVKAAYSVRVKSTDQDGLSTQKPIVIQVSDRNDVPQFSELEYSFEVADGSRQGSIVQANNGTERPSISSDGRFVSFTSYATNLGDVDFDMDIFVKDTESGAIYEASNTSTGGRSNGDSFNASMTPDGRYIVFESYASNLVPEDTSRTGDIFVRDLLTGALTRVSTSSTGVEGNDRSYSPSISDDGRYIAFRSDATNLVVGDTNGFGDIFVKDRETGQLMLASLTFNGLQGNNHSFEPAISGDGNTIAFRSYASNIVAGVDNNFEDIYVRNLRTGVTTRANTSSSGQQGNNAVWYPSLSYDGRFVSFPSTANNLVLGDTNGTWDVFVKDLLTNETKRVSTGSNGSEANGISNYARISADGRLVTFLSFATNLVQGDTNSKADVFVKDLFTGVTTRASTNLDGIQANDASFESILSATGSFIAFSSAATNLIPTDTNNATDIFVKNLTNGNIIAAATTNNSIPIGSVVASDQDAGARLRYSLTGVGSENFSIDRLTGRIFLSSNALMNFELEPTHSFVAIVSDGDLSNSVPITVHVTNGNNRPTEILLTSNTLPENSEFGSIVGLFSSFDPNPGDTFVYEFADGLGSTDNSAFTIDGNKLRLATGFDFETKSTYSIRIRSTDNGGLYKEKVFSVLVTDVDEGIQVLGTSSADTFVASYNGDGVNHTWSITRNGVSVFNGSVPNNISLVIDGLGGTDTLDIAGRTSDDLYESTGSLILLNNARVRFPRIETVKASGGSGNDRFVRIDNIPIEAAFSFDGGAGIDIVESIAGSNSWSITGLGIGVLGSEFSFLGVESLKGGTGSDQFSFGPSGSVTGQISGGDGSDSISYSAKTTASTVNLQSKTATSTGGFVGIESFNGSSILTLNDVIIGDNIDTVWSIDGINRGTISTAPNAMVTFRDFKSITGGSAFDRFAFSDSGRLSMTITGGTGTGVIDQIDLSSLTSSLQVNVATVPSISNIVGGFNSVEMILGNNLSASKITGPATATAWTVNSSGQIVVGGVVYRDIKKLEAGAGLDTLTGPSLSNTWTSDSINGGTLRNSESSIAFTGIENLVGGTAVDQFVFEQAGRLTGTINGGTGLDAIQLAVRIDAIEVRLGTVASITDITGGFSAIEQVIGNGLATSRIIGAATTTAWTINTAGDVVVGAVNFQFIKTIEAGSGMDTLTGPALASTWTVTSNNSGLLNIGASSVRFSGIENLTGSTAADQYVFESTGRVTGTINGSTGVDVIQLTSRTDAIEVRLGTIPSIVNIAGGFNGIEQVIGNALISSKVVGAPATTAWAVNSSGQIVVGTLAFHAISKIEAGTGVDTLTGPALANNWTISSTNTGMLDIGNLEINFTGVENLTGNIGDDSFSIASTGNLSGNLSGGTGAGIDSLIYSEWTSGVTVDLTVTAPAKATAIAGTLSNIQIVVGGLGNDIIKGQLTKSMVLIGLAGNDVLEGGAQRDLLFGGLGTDVFNGRDADDLLIAGSTTHDLNLRSLILIYTEWNSARDFTQRTSNLWGNGTGTRFNADIYLNSNSADGITDTVFADGSLDDLTGGLRQDWFFADLSEIRDFLPTGTTPDRRDS